MRFESILSGLQSGARFRRESWNNEVQYVHLVAASSVPGSVERFEMVIEKAGSIPWVPTAPDMFADDWKDVAVPPAADEPPMDPSDEPA